MRGARLLIPIIGVLASCRSTDLITPPTQPAKEKIVSPNAASADPARLDSLARALAIGFRETPARMTLRDALRDSPFEDHAVSLQMYLNAPAQRELASRTAAALHVLPANLATYLQSLPPLLIKLDRTRDRATWDGKPGVVVYSLPDAISNRPPQGPTAVGHSASGESVAVPLWDSGPGVYVLIVPADSGNTLSVRSYGAASAPTDRSTVSTLDEEKERTKVHAARGSGISGPGSRSNTILPDPCQSDPSCIPPSGGADSDGEPLPAQFTAAYCFGWTNWSGISPLDASNDKDADGLRDDCEYQLAYAFRPMLARNNADDAPEREPYYSVTRVAGTLTGVRIMYALSYYRDAGEHDTGIGAHDGDSEWIIVQLQNDMNADNYALWEVTQATLSAHWNSAVDRTSTYDAGSLEYPSRYRGRPRVWVSWDKHANYRSKDVCDYSVWFDVCDTAFTSTAYEDVTVWTDGNLGNSFNVTPASSATRFVDCTTSRHPGTGRAGYGVECFWEDVNPFAGWNQYYGQEASTPYKTILAYYQF